MSAFLSWKYNFAAKEHLFKILHHLKYIDVPLIQHACSSPKPTHSTTGTKNIKQASRLLTAQPPLSPIPFKLFSLKALSQFCPSAL